MLSAAHGGVFLSRSPLTIPFRLPFIVNGYDVMVRFGRNHRSYALRRLSHGLFGLFR